MEETGNNMVLVVDDEADVRDVLTVSLEDLGYTVICAEDGEEGLERFKKHLPSIVLADIKMPRMDGIELLEKIKQIDPETEVIMITGHGDMNFAVRSFRFDATDFITKPIGMDDLEQALKRAREKSTIRKQFYEYTRNLEAMLSQKTGRRKEGSLSRPAPETEGVPSKEGASVAAESGKLQQVLENLPCYITLYDQDLHILEANSYFVETFGEVIGEKCYYVCRRREEPCPECPVQKTFSRGKSCQHETEYITKDDQARKVLVWTLPVFDPGEKTVDQVMSVATDLDQVSELQDHLSSLGLMIGSLSHGMKGLLTGLDSGMYLINSGLANQNGNRTEEGLKIVQETKERLKRVVLDILFYAKEREFKKEPIRVKAFADDISSVVESRIASYGMTYRKDYGDDLGEIEIDPNIMLQAIMNIFENAINACTGTESKPEDQEITLSIRADNGRVCFIIKDTGIGMDEETKNSMFNLFFSTRGSKGTGLGLFVTRKIVEDHGGEIQVESTPGQGTAVYVYIPRQSAS